MPESVGIEVQANCSTGAVRFLHTASAETELQCNVKKGGHFHFGVDRN